MSIDLNKLTQGSWKSTLIGMLTAVVIAVYPLLEGGKPTREQLIMAALAAAAGYVVKDSNVTGGTKPNPYNEPTAVMSTSSDSVKVVPAIVAKEDVKE